MRAMMSDHVRRDQRVAFIRVGATANLPASNIACAEAIAILAEVEPQQTRPAYGACEHPPMRIRNPRAGGRLLRANQVRHWQPRQDVAWEMRKALAEALAAWIKGPKNKP